MDRRGFLKTCLGAVGTLGSTALLGDDARAEGDPTATEFVGVLVDTTRCIGCRGCEEACAEANGLPAPDIDSAEAYAVFDQERNPSVTQFSVVNRFGEDEEIFVKRQCMHCNQPACAAACLTKAMLKTDKGPVIWREDKCMGCRFCMLSCPFNIPQFEYDKAIPRIMKCHLCFGRLQEGEQPACTEVCPEEAIVFGTRRDLLDEGRTRIYSEPDKYVHHIYGEHEAGGTGWLYLASVPFEKLGFNTHLEMQAYPKLAKGFLYSVAVVFLLWPPFLLALSRATGAAEEIEEEEL
ncbi:MAG TPA: 4Fe-4S dicluster domain-containing protein [Myxococcota bacterium]